MRIAHWRRTASALTLLVAAASTFVALMAGRPHLAPSALAGNGDDLAFATAWMFGVVCALWLTLTTLACLVALLHGRPRIAMRIAGFGPPLARRLLQTALVGTFAVMPAAAHATPSAPLVLHVGPGGQLTSLPGDPPNDAPVVRTPHPAPSATVPATMLPTATAPTTTPPPPSMPPVAVPRPAPTPTVRNPDAADHVRVARQTLVVRRGDNLWSIAAAETARVTGVTRPDRRVVAGYWVRLIAANRSTLRSGDPSLIFPGELIRVPDFEH